MKKYIHGVGSGLPIVKEYMETKQGNIQIEDNLESGAVVTISLNSRKNQLPGVNPTYVNSSNSGAGGSPIPENVVENAVQLAASSLSPRQISILKLFDTNSAWRSKDISEETGIPPSTTHGELKKLQEAGMMTRLGMRYAITELGAKVAQSM